MTSTVRFVTVLFLFLIAIGRREPAAQSPLPTLTDPNLMVREVISGLEQPTSMAFIGGKRVPGARESHRQGQARAQRRAGADRPRSRGQQRVRTRPARHRAAPAVRDEPIRLFVLVVLGAARASTFQPSAPTCPATPATGDDTDDVLAVPLLGNRVDRFVWNGSALQFDRNLINLRSFQNDRTNGVPRGNHNGGVIRFGGDGKLYVIFGDNGRRGQLQNLTNGVDRRRRCRRSVRRPGPGPRALHRRDSAAQRRWHARRRTIRSSRSARGIGGDVGGNLQRTFAYGVRNSFGMAFDPVSGDLWDQQNGDDTFDEMNRVTAGHRISAGCRRWVRSPRVAEFKAIETVAGAARSAAAALVADADRRYAEPGARAPVHAAGRALRRS